MPALHKDLDKAGLWIEQGALYSLVVTFYADETRTTLFDFTDWTAEEMFIRAAQKPDAALLMDVVDAGGTVTLGGAAGTLTIEIDDDVTDVQDWENGFYHIEASNPDGNRIRLMEGKIVNSRRIVQ